MSLIVKTSKKRVTQLSLASPDRSTEHGARVDENSTGREKERASPLVYLSRK